MGKSTLNTALGSLSGTVDNWVYSERAGRTIVRRRPQPSGLPPTAAQIAVREAFIAAANYAKQALADPTAYQVYADAARVMLMPAFAVAVGDYLKPPVIEEIGLAAFNGQIGDRIVILASDDVGVMSVNVVVRQNSTAAVLEQGAAVLTNNVWVYTATTQMPLNQDVAFEVTAVDRPGHTAMVMKPYRRTA